MLNGANTGIRTAVSYGYWFLCIASLGSFLLFPFVVNPYFRQYFNKSYTFLAGGINLHNYVFNKEKVILNASIDFWQQPKNLNFNTKDAQFGIGLKSEIGMRLSNWDANSKSTYFNLGFSYKTIGFIPETPSLKEDFRIHLGVIYSILN